MGWKQIAEREGIHCEILMLLFAAGQLIVACPEQTNIKEIMQLYKSIRMPYSRKLESHLEIRLNLLHRYRLPRPILPRPLPQNQDLQ
jgi:hypothetical protein